MSQSNSQDRKGCLREEKWDRKDKRKPVMARLERFFLMNESILDRDLSIKGR